MGRVALLEARRRHIHEEPAVATQLRARRDQMLLEGVYAVAVSNVPPPGPEQVAMAWERLKPQFTRLERVRVAEFVTPDSTLIMRVAREGGLRGPLAAAVQKADPAQSVTETEVLYPSDDPAWAGLQGMFQQQQPGVWFGPEKTATGWRILQLVDKTMAQQQFEELPASVQQSIAGSASEIVRDTRFKQYTDSLAAAFKPRQNQAVIAKLPWPMRPRELAAR